MEMSLGHPYAPMATVVALSMASLLPRLLFGRDAERRYKEMPGQRYDASRLTGRRPTATERLMLAEQQYRPKARLSSRLSLSPNRQLP